LGQSHLELRFSGLVHRHAVTGSLTNKQFALSAADTWAGPCVFVLSSRYSFLTSRKRTSSGGFGVSVARCLLSAMFICAFWWLAPVTDLASSTLVTFAFAAAFLINLSLPSNKAWELLAVTVAGAAYALGYMAHGGAIAILPGS
jgi:hypothetical protein